MAVKELSADYVVTAEPQDSVQSIAKKLYQQKVGCVIIQEQGKPVGIITDRDIVVTVVEEGQNPEIVTAKQVMSPDPVTIDSDASLSSIVNVMAEYGFRRLPVVKGGRVVNIITLDDVLRLLTDELAKLGGVLEEESPRKTIGNYL